MRATVPLPTMTTPLEASARVHIVRLRRGWFGREISRLVRLTWKEAIAFMNRFNERGGEE